jgi:ABC-type branched-subunit amino acid transport system ATPase component
MLDRAVLTTCAVQLDDKRITGLAADKVVRKGVALLPEGRRVFGPLSVLENLRLGAYSAPRDGGETLETVFSMFPILRQRRSGAAGLLSGGEQQMLAFGRALMSQPRIMMLDEPSMGLAPAMVKKVAASVRQMADSGIGILMVEPHADLEPVPPSARPAGVRRVLQRAPAAPGHPSVSARWETPPASPLRSSAAAAQFAYGLT